MVGSKAMPACFQAGAALSVEILTQKRVRLQSVAKIAYIYVIRLFMKKFILFLLLAASLSSFGQIDSAKYPPPVTFTAEQDHQNMMDQLGIKSLRPGPSGNEAAPNHANYDEATAKPYPNLPDVLTLKNGR